MRRALATCVVGMLVGCQPDLGDAPSLITATSILAVRADPPEARPGAEIAYRALVASPGGTVEDARALWAFCAAPKPLTENNAVSTECLADGVRPIGGPAVSIDAKLPVDACTLFGPDPPQGELRPRDPDSTGGFYQPVRLRLSSLTAFTLTRVTCDLPNAPIDVAIDLVKRYVANRNPTLAPLRAVLGGKEIALDAIPGGALLELRTGWSEGDAEAYPMFDPGSGMLVNRREALRVSWFATEGELGNDVTGREEDDPVTSTETTFRAPGTPGVVHLWLVLRDSRGGSDFASYDLTVVP